jgi:hypothetical protein
MSRVDFVSLKPISVQEDNSEGVLKMTYSWFENVPVWQEAI